MALRDILRTAVKIADGATKSVQAEVSYRRCTAVSTKGVKSYGSKSTLKAIVELKQRSVRQPDGTTSVVNGTSVLFLDVAALKLATNDNGLSDKDEIVLPRGKTGPILMLGGFVDAGTGTPVATEAFIR